jgi:hypothetical protein
VFNVILKSITNGHTCAMCTTSQLVTTHNWSSIPNQVVFPISMSMVAFGVTQFPLLQLLSFIFFFILFPFDKESHVRKNETAH